MSFKKKQIWQSWSFRSSLIWLKNLFSSFAFYVKLVFVVVFIWVIFYFSTFAIDFWKNLLKDVSFFVVNTVSSNFWEEMEKDDFWQINALILGYDDWYLADSIMIASYDPALWSVSFLSIPRDLYVSNSEIWYNWRVNWILPTVYRSTWNLSDWLTSLIDTVEKITWVHVDYYALIDFDWFVNLVDSVWWIDIDVPERLYDNKYPTPDWWYQTFVVEEWKQTFDWDKALKYARSRQTTSDFSRSFRQQLIIEALVDEIISTRNIANVSNLQNLYWEFTSMLDTNISFRQMLWAVNYVTDLNYFHNSVLTADCDRSYFETTDVWCFLYYPRRELFWWSSVLLQEWASENNIANYSSIHNFSFMFLHNQAYLIESAEILIKNWVERSKLIQEYWRSEPIANNLWIELKKYWFNVVDVENSDSEYEKTTIYISDEDSFSSTINLLKMFFSFDTVVDEDLDSDIEIILWESFISS